MTNSEIASIFDEMAELLEIQGGEPHRARAFRNVAGIVGKLPEPAARMVRYGTLGRTPGIGAGTLHRIKEILRRGTTSDLVQLRGSLPPGLRQMLKIKGLGPRTVRRLYQRHRIASVATLESAARSGLLMQQAGFGVDRVHAILREIRALQMRSGKLPLVEALEIAERIAAQLRAVPGTVKVAFGGSCRRRKAMIGDLDFLAAAESPEALVECFTELEGTTLLTRRREGGSIRLKSSQQADLWIFPPESWGAGLHAFSGTKAHVVALRTRAGRMGLHISEHGVFHRDRSRRVTPGTREEEIFEAVGLPFIPPELRQNLGEIEAAEQGRLPTPVEVSDLRGDLHMHTTASDGSGSALDMARAALDLGYEYIAITDHSKSLTVARGLDEHRLEQQTKKLRRLEQRLGSLRILSGIEVDILADGSLDLDSRTLAGLDWVVASVHAHMDMHEEEMTQRVIRALESGLVDCLGHPTGRRLGRRDPYPIDIDQVLRAASRLGVAVEINANPYRMDIDEVVCRQARELRVPVVINSDAHSPAHLGRRFFGEAMAQRGWLEKKHILNTQSVDAVENFRGQRLRRGGVMVGRTAAPSAEPEPAPGARDRSRSIDHRLVETPLTAALERRYHRFLAEGNDPELEAALSASGTNPIQRAFEILNRSRQTSD